MHLRLKTAVLSVLCLLASASLNAAQQTLTTSPASLAVEAGATALDLTVSYDTDPADARTPGVGISVFFDSSRLSLVSLTALYGTDLLQATTTPSSVGNDSSNLDGDSATDKRALIAYASLDTLWPSVGVVRPVELFSVRFDAVSATWTGTTPINVRATTLASGYSASNPSVAVTFSAAATTDTSDTSTTPTAADDCFIATAAFGSYEHGYVRVLRRFRDEHLLTNTLGTRFVGLYYRYSPPLATQIAADESLKRGVRTLIYPLVGFARMVDAFGWLGSMGLFMGAGLGWVGVRRRIWTI